MLRKIIQQISTRVYLRWVNSLCMKPTSKLPKILFITGVVSLLLGTLDPMEGSVLIWAGSVLLTLSAYLSASPFKRHLLYATVAISVGVAYLFIISSFGGFGGNTRSMWWGLPILPYPLGWLYLMGFLLYTAFRKKSRPAKGN